MAHTSDTSNNNHAKKNDDGIIANAMNGAKSLMSGVGGRMAPVGEFIRNSAEKRPLLALAGAIGIGFLIGNLIRRGRA